MSDFWERYTAECTRIGASPNGSQMADALGTTKSTIGNWKRLGTLPTAQYLVKLAEIFGVSVDYLLGVSAPAADQAIALEGKQGAPDAELQRFASDAQTAPEQQLAALRDRVKRRIDGLGMLDLVRVDAYLAGLQSAEMR